MPTLISRTAKAFALALVVAFSVSASAAIGPSLSARPQVRVLSKVDTTKLATLPNSHPNPAGMYADQGRLAPSTAMGPMSLVLTSSDAQIYALHSLLDQQQDKSSPYYHQWLTPESFGASFGAASSDITAVTSWLQDAGFTVQSIAKGARIIRFTGTSGQVESAFHTEMHTVLVDGESHRMNTTDISVPQALAPIIAGVTHLNDFRPKKDLVNYHPVVRGTDGQYYPVIPGTLSPDYTSLSSGSHYVGPADLATIFNAAPLQAAGINGAGVTIGILGQTTIALSNVETYRQMFNLPVNDPTIINTGPAPAVIADDIESDLDVDLAGSLATNAKVNFYTDGYGLYNGGIDGSALFAVDTNVPDIISLSYGGCELSNGSAGTAFWNTLWEQAAAQGQTVFVSSGDSSATGCASSSAALATGTTAGSYGVNALGSSAYNVAVGGSEFNEGTALGVTPYWGPGGVSPYGTALSYIPETVWSEGAFDVVTQGSGVAGGGGGVSMFTARPPWQVGPGINAADPAGPTFTASGAIPAGTPHRLVPDLALIAASGHDGTIFCSEGVCKINSDGTIGAIGVVGGTSVATPAMASVQALIDQKNGGRQGNANYYYYKLAAAQNTAACASTAPPSAACNFHDIVTGDNYSPKTSTGKYNVSTGTISGVLGTDYIGFPATTGYDEATGLGSPNVTNLANNWKSVTFNSTTTTLNLSPLNIVHGTQQTAVITVAANSGSGTPTGDVSITAIGQSAGASNGNQYTLSAGTVTATFANLPGGTYSVSAHYAGDSVYGPSDSAPVTVTITKEPAQIFLTPYYITTAGNVGTATSFAYGSAIYVDTDTQGQSATGVNNNNVLNTGVPTGTITYSLTNNGAALPGYVSTLDFQGITYLEVAQSFANFLVYANYPAIVPGNVVVTAAYSGDNSFGAVSGTTGFTVTKATVAPKVTAGSAEIASGAPATLNVSIAANGGGALPTGTATLVDTTTSTTLGTVSLVNGLGVLTTTAITQAGANSIVATYNGDGNYTSANSTAVTVTVGGTSTSLSLISSLAATKVLQSVTLTATAPTGVTGTVYFYDGGTLSLGSAAINTTTHQAALAVTTLVAGTHNITATYAGSTTYQSATSNTVQIITSQNTPTLALTTQTATVGTKTVSMNGQITYSPAPAAAPNPAPTVNIQFLDGATVKGSAPITRGLNYTTTSSAAFTMPALTPGVHQLTAFFPGDTNYAAVTSNVQVVNVGLTSLSLTSSTTNVGTNIPFTLTATVTPLVSAMVTIGGTVTFYDNVSGTPVSIGTGTVTAGVAKLTTTFTTAATHPISAVYSGDANFYTSSTTTSVNIVSVVGGFTLSANPSSLTITRGTSGTVTITATSYGNWNGTGPLTCYGLPANSFCTFTTTPFVFNGVNGSQNTTLTITTLNPHAGGGTASLGGFLWLPAVLLAGFLGLRRKHLTLRGRQLMVFAILLCGMAAVSGCSSLGLATPTGPSTVIVQANGVPTPGNGSSAVQPTTTIALTVQ